MNETEICQVKIEQLAETARQLPALPQTTSNIISLLGDPLFEVSQLIRLVSLDAILTTTLLRSANSAAHATSRSADSVGASIMRLGSGAVLAMAVAQSARPPADYDLRAFGLTTEAFWRHGVNCVAAAEELQFRRIARFGQGFSAAALLHDFGKLILSKHITADRLMMMSQHRESHPGAASIETERAILGIDHAVAGGVVARHWNLADEIAVTIENHHNSAEWDDDLTNGVILANQMARENNNQNDYCFSDSENVADAMLSLGVDDAMYQSVVAGSQKRFDVLIELFG